MTIKHPYVEFENTKLWGTIDVALTKLEKNHDLKLETAREYVIGSLCKELVRDRVVTDNSISKAQ